VIQTHNDRLQTPPPWRGPAPTHLFAH
jgi:hypothetical protein